MPTFTSACPTASMTRRRPPALVAERYGTRHHEQRMVPSLVEHLPELVHHLDEPSDPLVGLRWLVSQMAGASSQGGAGRRRRRRAVRRLRPLLRQSLRRLLRHAAARGAARRDEPASCSLHARRQLVQEQGPPAKWLHHASFLTGGERYARSWATSTSRRSSRRGCSGRAARATPAASIPTPRSAEPTRGARRRTRSTGCSTPTASIRLPDHPVDDPRSDVDGARARGAQPLHGPQGGRVLPPRLPTELKVRWRTLRYIQQRLCERYLPREVLARKKQGFSSAAALSAPRRVPPALRVLPLTVGAGPRTAIWGRPGSTGCASSTGRVPTTATASGCCSMRKRGTGCTFKVRAARPCTSRSRAFPLRARTAPRDAGPDRAVDHRPPLQRGGQCPADVRGGARRGAAARPAGRADLRRRRLARRHLRQRALELPRA